MRKAYLTITTRTMVPIISKVEAIITIDEGHTDVMAIAKRLISGKIPNYITVEDLPEVREPHDIEGFVDPDPSVPMDMFEKLTDYLTSEDATSRVIDVEVTDSK